MSSLHVVVLAQLLVAGGAVVLRSKAQASEQFFAYDYSKHGQDWAAGSCSSRSRQSPIDLPPAPPVTGSFSYKYNKIEEPFELMNNGHAYSADLGGLGYGGITYENAVYNLLNVNVHSLSEHTWAGVQQPLELHMVHKRYDGEGLLIVAVAVESPMLTGAALAAAAAAAAARGGAFLQNNASQAPLVPKAAGASYLEPSMLDPLFNPTLQAFLKMPPPPPNMKIRVPADSAHSFDLNTFMQGAAPGYGAQFYEYAGSLTAPPCAEIATWLVRKDTIKASDTQVLYLHDLVFKTTGNKGNYRSVMPVNGRVVSMRQGKLEDLPPTAAPQVKIASRPQQSDREYRAMKWAQDAMTIANSATAYVKDIDSRLRKAAQAHANALAPQMEPLTVHGQVVGTDVNANQTLEEHMAAIGEAPPAPTQSPLEMQRAAETMARTLANTARQEIEDATEEISKRSKDVAMKAARDAAIMVMSGNLDKNAAAPAGAPVKK